MITELQTLINERLKVSPTQIAKFCQRWKITEFALFGSVLRDNFRPDSDIDVLVTFAPDVHVSLFAFVDIQDELAELFKRDVDVVSKSSIQESENYLRRQHILSSANLIYSSDPQANTDQFNPQLKLIGHFTEIDRDRTLLLDIVLASRKIQQYVAGVDGETFEQSTLLQDASVRQLEILGEAARRLSQPMRDSYPDIPWSAILGMKNRLIHDYNRVNTAIIWNVIFQELPDLIAKIEPQIPPNHNLAIF